MFIVCPQCKGGNLIDDGEFSGISHIRIRCTKCRTAFAVTAPVQGAAAATISAETAKTEVKETTTATGSSIKLPTGKRVSLVVIAGPAKGEIFELSKPEVCIGRIAGDVIIKDPEISSTHCALEIREEVAELKDMGSKNGTFVGGVQVKRHQLNHLSEFRLGETMLMFVVTKVE